MKTKVCGLVRSEDILRLAASGIDYAGMVFYPASSRFAGGKLDTSLLGELAVLYPRVKRVGVFVDADPDEVVITAEKYNLNALQFHGHESPEYCRAFCEEYEVIKAFRIGGEEDFRRAQKYEKSAQRFLFDTAGPLPGGNGRQWDWSLINMYTGSIPFFLSGGIRAGDVLKVSSVRHSRFFGIDLNSGFELAPGIKDADAVTRFIHNVH